MVMALSEILALVSLAAALLFVAQALPWSRPGAGGDALLLDLLHGAGLLDLATRSNMILLCHAILIALLGNAGLLTNNNRSHSHSGKNAAADNDDPWWPAASREPEPVPRHVAITEIEGGTWRTGGGASWMIHGRHLVAAAAGGEFRRLPQTTTATAPDGKTVSVSSTDLDDDQAPVAKNGAEEEEVTTEWQISEECGEDDGGQEEEEEDLDEMNRRFEAFIAATKEKMRLEAMHPSPPENRAALLVW